MSRLSSLVSRSLRAALNHVPPAVKVAVLDACLTMGEPEIVANLLIPHIRRLPLPLLERSVREMLPLLPAATAPEVRCSQSGTPFPHLGSFLRAFATEPVPDVLVFGDSVALRTADDEADVATFSELYARDLAPRYRTLVVAGSGFHAQVFHDFCRLLIDRPRRPAVAVIPVNLRSFSPSWDLNPDYQFVAELAMTNNLASERAAPPRGPISREVFAAIPLRFGDRLYTVEEILDIVDTKPSPEQSDAWAHRLRHIFMFHYQFPIHPRHRKLRALTATIELLSTLGIHVIVYTTPINYEAGALYVGPEFLQQVQANVGVLRLHLPHHCAADDAPADRSTVLFEDYSLNLPSSAFFTPHNATEHLRATGRRHVVTRVLKQAMPLVAATRP